MPTSEIGIASTGMIEARAFCRKTTITNTTSTMASSSVSSTASMLCAMNSVGL